MKDKQYMSMVASLGCIICGQAANLHHPRFAAGLAQRASDRLVIPLCPWHHQDGPWGTALHKGQENFEKQHGSEQELLAKTITAVVDLLEQDRMPF